MRSSWSACAAALAKPRIEVVALRGGGGGTNSGSSGSGSGGAGGHMLAKVPMAAVGRLPVQPHSFTSQAVRRLAAGVRCHRTTRSFCLPTEGIDPSAAATATEEAAGGSIFDGIQTDNSFVRELPADSDTTNKVRQVQGACFSRVTPTAASSPSLFAFSAACGQLLGLPQLHKEDLASAMEAAQVLAGKLYYKLYGPLGALQQSPPRNLVRQRSC